MPAMEFIIPDVDFTISTLLFLISLFFLYISWKKLTSTKVNMPPEVGGAWPIIGHLHLLGSLPHLTLSNMADKYGPIFTVRLGVKPPTIVISNPELAKEIFTTHDLIISSRPKFLVGQHLGYNYALFGFSPYGPYWREMRKLVTVEMLSVRRLELLRYIRVSEMELQLTELFKYWMEKRDGSGRVSMEMKQWFGDLNMNVVLRMVAGKRYFGAMAEGEAAERKRCRRVIGDFFELAGSVGAADFIPILGWVDLGGTVKRMKQTWKDVDGLLQEWLDEHRRKRRPEVVAAGEEQTGEKDFMDVMLKIIKEEVFVGRDPDTIIKATCLALITGGSESTTVMLVLAISLLLRNSHVLRKAQEELDIHIGRDRRFVNESDINNLVYLQAIVKETLRISPASPLAVMREFTENCKIAGYHIPKGTRLVVNMWKLHRDAKVWPDPEEFKPERFLTTHKDFDVIKGRNLELIPFGAGRRICPGAAFGIQMLHLVLANFLHAFDLTTPGDQVVDMSQTLGLTDSKTTSLDVLVMPRLPLSAY